MNKPSLLLTAAALCLFQVLPAVASTPITPYKERGTSGHFSYAIYNNRWLLHGKRAEEEKHLTRIAITGISAEAEGKVVIPSAIEGHEVYGIDDNALKACREVADLVIPKTVRFLKPGTLNRCQGLENIIIADDHPDFASVDGVMFDKAKTTLLAVANGREGHYEVPATTKEIGPGALAFCTGLTRVTIPAGVTDIGGHSGWVFQGCVNLERVDLPETVTNIGQKSFQDCSSLKEVALPPKLAAIPFGLFWRCGELTEVTMPDGIASIGNYAFADCAKLTLEKLPRDLTKVGSFAFKGCKGLKGLKVPGSVITIERGAFQGCDVILPKVEDA